MIQSTVEVAVGSQKFAEAFVATMKSSSRSEVPRMNLFFNYFILFFSDFAWKDDWFQEPLSNLILVDEIAVAARLRHGNCSRLRISS